jgi:ATP-dependent exoDNAse (exonuclease V) alpha subunit
VLPLSQGKNFSAYQTEKLALSLGDRVRITKNFVVRDMDGKARCRNNDVHTVTAITEDGIGLSNGVSLKRGYWHLDQGLIVTSHAAQGKTVDQVLVSIPIRTFSQVNEAQWYVSLSGARAAMFVFTDSIGALKEAVMRPSGRVSAHEMLGELSSLRDRNLRFSPNQETGVVPERAIEKIAIQRNR